jgi:ABC-type polysaccharide/polyol phosphate transport system ATPase subunit
MGTIVIHAGGPKAGSSSVQHWLASNAKRLRREQDTAVAVAHAGDPLRVSEFNGRKSINSHAVGMARKRGADAWGAMLPRFFSEIQALSARHRFLLLTSETFDQLLWRADEPFLRGLDELAAGHRVVLSYYVRPQHTAVEAAWRQWGFRYDLAPSLYVSGRAEGLHYATTYDHVRRLAPRVVFEPRPFRTDLLDEGSVVTDFARRNLEIEVPPGDAPPINRGLPLELVNLLRSAPTGMFWSSAHDNANLQRIKTLFKDVQIPESAEVRRSRLILQAFCHRTFEAGNRELIRKLGWPTTEFVPPPDEPVEGELEDLDDLWSPNASPRELEDLFAAIAQALDAPRRRPKSWNRSTIPRKAWESLSLSSAPMGRRENAIEVRDVSKAFRIPVNRAVTLRHRVLHPLERRRYRPLQALEDVSFDVREGEFFGIVGRNGSGKSTLLKLIASIYRADGGTIRVAGRMAPFIELGVGFNPELSARDNVILNGVMMGLTPREARLRYDEVIEFAELEEFTELKLRNYSSGMRVRLAFAVMVQVDADVMVIDEVLAVGDASFQERCAETFAQLIDRGKTIVLVTHSMASIRQYCHRALLLEAGRVDTIGDPAEVAARYTEVNFAHQKIGRGLRKPGDPRVPRSDPLRLARITDAWIEGGDRKRTSSVGRREPIELRAQVELKTDLGKAWFALEIWTAGGGRIFAPVSPELDVGDQLSAGERVVIAATIENRLTPGRYRLNCGLSLRGQGQEVPITPVFGVAFEVSGARIPGSVADLETNVRIEPHVRADVVRS